jgi:hypothetical protein
MTNPRYMNSKFDSLCCNCGSHINAGERIRYLGRSKAECRDCMPSETKAAPAANDWASALAWDESEPAPGASIGATQQIETAQRTGTPVADIVQPIRPSDDVVIKLTDTGAHIIDQIKPSDDKLADTGARIIEQAKAKPEPEPIESFDFSNSERAEALTSELLIILVNAIDVAGITGRHTLATYCREQARRALDMSSRQHIWHGIAQAIDRA